jgi:hypothetical protein
MGSKQSKYTYTYKAQALNHIMLVETTTGGIQRIITRKIDDLQNILPNVLYGYHNMHEPNEHNRFYAQFKLNSRTIEISAIMFPYRVCNLNKASCKPVCISIGKSIMFSPQATEQIALVQKRMIFNVTETVNSAIGTMLKNQFKENTLYVMHRDAAQLFDQFYILFSINDTGVFVDTLMFQAYIVELSRYSGMLA